jgi:hypothetical protein
MSLYNPEKFGVPSPIWFGVIEPEPDWTENERREKWSNSGDIPGFGSRYRVRITSQHSEKRSVISGKELPMAGVSFPVTAGTGRAGSRQTANLRQGDFVWGFFHDPVDCTEPFIVGCYANNDRDQVTLQKFPTEFGFDPISGYTESSVNPFLIPGVAGAPTEANTGSTTAETSQGDIDQRDDGEQKTALRVSTDCDKIQLGAIQLQIQKLIQDLEKFKKGLKGDWIQSLRRPIAENGQQYSIEEYINYKIQNVSKEISKGMKWIIEQIEKYVLKVINGEAKKLYFLIFPEQRSNLKDTIETVNDLIACLFRKIIKNLFKMIGKFLRAIIDRFINAPLCAIENIVGALIGKLTGLINSAISAIMAPLNAILGIVDIAGDIIGFVQDLLSFLSCEEEPECPEVREWSIWDGSPNSQLPNLSGLVNKVKTFASSVQQNIDPDNFDFDLDFSDIFQDTCNVGPIFCGPPIVEFYGGGGSGAAGNAIISATGDILGVDLTSFGSGYTSAPVVNFVDNCGKGRGARGRAILSGGAPVTAGGTPVTAGGTGGTPVTAGGTGGTPVTAGGTGGQVIGVIIENPGFGYLPDFDGSRGGDGRTWATPEQVTIERENGTYDTPYNPGEIFEVFDGDVVTGPFTKQDVKRSTFPTNSSGQYNVVLKICNTAIVSAGINYSPNDVIIVEPANGAVLKPQFGSAGELLKIDILDSGSGFEEMPRIYIRSNTGYNAEILPLLCVNRIGDVPESDYSIPFGEKIIKVVDCVGKV